MLGSGLLQIFRANSSCDWGDRALQECNLSTQLAVDCSRASSPAWDFSRPVFYFFFVRMPLQTTANAINSSFLLSGEAAGSFRFRLRGRCWGVTEPVAAAGNLDNFG